MFHKCFVLFLLAHVLADFYLQTERTAKEKDEVLRKVITHCIWYTVIVFLTCVGTRNGRVSTAALFLSVMHAIIDVAKFFIQKKMSVTKSHVFIMDQLLHLTGVVSAALIVAYGSTELRLFPFFYVISEMINVSIFDITRWVTALLFIGKPCGILIQRLTVNFKPEGVSMADEIQKAGRTIGYLERIIIFVLIAMEQYAAIGFVITAKSIARYDQITKEKSFAEYYLLGTMYSLVAVMGVGVVFVSYLGQC